MVDLAPGPGLLRIPRRFPMFVVALGTLVASACSSNSVDVQGDDNNVIIPTFRTTLAIFPENQRSIAETLRRKKMFRPAAPDQNVAPEDTVASVDPEVEPPLEPIEGTLAIDFRFAFGKSDTAHQVGAGQLLSLNGTTFFVPTDVAADFALYSWTVAARGGVRIREILSLEGLGGLGIQSYDLDLESGGGGRSRQQDQRRPAHRRKGHAAPHPLGRHLHANARHLRSRLRGRDPRLLRSRCHHFAATRSGAPRGLAMVELRRRSRWRRRRRDQALGADGGRSGYVLSHGHFSAGFRKAPSPPWQSSIWD